MAEPDLTPPPGAADGLDLAPLPDPPPDFFERVRQQILKDAGKMLLTLSGELVVAVACPHGAGGDRPPVTPPLRILRLVEAYSRQIRPLFGLIANPFDLDEGVGELGMELGDNFGRPPMMGMARGHGRFRGDPIDQVLGGLNGLADVQRLPNLVAAMRNAQDLGDQALVARLRREIDIALGDEPGTLPPLPPPPPDPNAPPQPAEPAPSPEDPGDLPA